MRRSLLVSALALPAALAGGVHGEAEECSCAQFEPDHPFTIDCDAPDPIRAATVKLETTCKEATSYEWGGAFATPANGYKWVAQAVDGAYADPAMKLVVFDVHAADKEHLLELAANAATLMAGDCTAVSSGGDIPAPTASGACYQLTFPEDASADFQANVDTTGVANVAFFGEHVPTEFERDTHYFMSTDLATDIEPVATLGAPAAHDHGRRLSQRINEAAAGSKLALMNNRRSRRRLASPGTCCQNGQQRGAWKQVVAYHDLCDYNQVPEYIEIGFHDYEASCEDYFCNLVGPDVDQTVCPFSPPSPPASPPVQDLTGALIGVAAAAGAVILLILVFLCCMISKEKAGKPIFTNITTEAKTGA